MFVPPPLILLRVITMNFLDITVIIIFKLSKALQRSTKYWELQYIRQIVNCCVIQFWLDGLSLEVRFDYFFEEEVDFGCCRQDTRGTSCGVIWNLGYSFGGGNWAKAVAEIPLAPWETATRHKLKEVAFESKRAPSTRKLS